MLTMSPETFALAFYVQGAIAAYATTPNKTVSGAALARITEDAIVYINAYLVITSQATIGATSYRAGFSRTMERIALR